MPRLTLVIVFFSGVAATQQFPQTCPPGTTSRLPTPNSTGIDSCGINGSAGAQSPDGLQNAVKNNFCMAESAVPSSLDVATVKTLQVSTEKEEKKRKLKPGSPPNDRSFLSALGEGRLVTFEGFVFAARQECAESVNCGSGQPDVDGSHDIHISFLGQPRKTKPTDPPSARDAEECGGFVAEFSPHHRPDVWTACNVNDVAAKGLRVRITGQQFFDGSHVPCKGGHPSGDNPKRVSLWEIHPIYSFEVCPSGDCASGGWVPLETFAAGKTACKNQPCTGQ